MKGIKVYKLQKNKNNPNLIIGELKKKFGFICKRFFFILGDKNEIRGHHAHKKQLQFMVCLSGSCQLEFDNFKTKKSIKLDNNKVGVKVSSGIWGVQKYLEKNTLLLVLSDAAFNEKDYLRDYKDFKKFIKSKK